MIEIKNLTKVYGKNTEPSVDHINLQVKDGEIFGFLGPNGAGKTTTIKMMVGLLRQTEGNIRFNGMDTLDESLKCKEILSYVPDNPNIYEVMSGMDYLNFIADIFGMTKEFRKEKIEEYADAFAMKEHLNDFIKSYSHGMKQKIVLIGAFIHEPKILILDEPMVGLDPKSAFRLKEMMRSHCDKGNIVFFSTHVLEVAEKICDRVAIINKGKIIAQGTMEELRDADHNADGTLENIFLELTENA